MKNQKGSALMIVMFLMFATLTVCASAAVVAQTATIHARTSVNVEQMYYDTESAAQLAMSMALDLLAQPGKRCPFVEVPDMGDDHHRRAHLGWLNDPLTGQFRIIEATIESDPSFAGIEITLAPNEQAVDSTLTYTHQPTKIDEITGLPVPDGPLETTTTYVYGYNYNISVEVNNGSRSVTVSTGNLYDVSVKNTPTTVLPTGPTGGVIGGVEGGGVVASGNGHLNTNGTIKYDLNGSNVASSNVPLIPISDAEVERLDMSAYVASVKSRIVSPIIESGVKTVTGNGGGRVTIRYDNAGTPDKVLTGVTELRVDDSTLVGDFTGIDLYLTGNCTLGDGTNAFFSNNTAESPTFIYSTGDLEVKMGGGLTMMNVTLASDQRSMKLTGSTTGTVRTNATFYSEKEINIESITANRWDSSAVPQFLAGGGLNATITVSNPDANAMKGIFYCKTHLNVTLNLGGKRFDGLLLSYNTQPTIGGNAAVNLLPDLPWSELDQSLVAYHQRASSSGTPGYTQNTQSVDVTSKEVGRKVQGG